MQQTYSGACHCRAVQFEVDFDLAAGTGKCNCSYCSKLRFWLTNAKFQNFRLLCGESNLSDYQGTNPVAHHLFCKRCGIHPFEWIDMPNISGEKYYNINVLCLDNLDLSDLLSAPVEYFDGLHDNWGGHHNQAAIRQRPL
jgi:hypothetical protein